ncbi:type IV pilin protein [Rheinheimera sp. D18]|uniref:type IV pilin protein n=1 Tax=Rheinheimera sp. D18 TaxID=2545632 RepID=UPI0010448BFA|nr:type IV pilin protein [Rheinheimera sp. D18]QBL10198.1 type IV pilin protein [Rheinheimera sp. D18]
MNKNKQTGFSLVEVMIVVLIIGILASVAFPSYRDYVLTSNRTAAQACLMELSQVMERSYTQNMRYNPNGFVLPNLQCRNDLAARYTFALAAVAERTYRLSAAPTSIQSDGCGTLLLTHTGQKGAQGGFTAADVDRCW